MKRSRRDIVAVLDGVFASLPREWTAKEGAPSFSNYLHYLRAIARCAEEIRRERGADPENALNLLDIGLGMGVIGCACSLMGMHVTGVDNQRNTDHPLLRPIREKFRVAYADYNALTDNLPFGDCSFDIVNSNDMIEHIHGTPKRMLAECHRVLRPGGRIVITTPNLGSLHNRLQLLVGRSVHHSIRDWFHNPTWERPVFTGHIREYTVGEVRYMLREVGFRDVRMKPFNSLPGSASTPPADASKMDYSGWFSYIKDMPFYDRGFHLRSKRDAAYLGLALITTPFPGMRRDLLAVARKDRIGALVRAD